MTRAGPITARFLCSHGIELLTSGSVLSLVEWLDLAFAEHYSTSEHVFKECKARLTLALGYSILEQRTSRIEQTLNAAEAYLADPVDSNWSSFFQASSNSYPFGPGGGCYGIDELGHGKCGRGSGCSSGFGFLYWTGKDQRRIAEAVRSALLEWSAMK